VNPVFYNVIAIAGLPGSGKSTLLEELYKLSAFSNWDMISTGGLLRKRHAFLIDKKKFKGDFISYLNNLSDEEIRILNKEARSLAIKGNLVLDSRYAVENCRNLPSAFLVFLTAPLETRIERQKKAHPEKSHDEIKKDLEQREQWELEKGLSIYNYDYRGYKQYNLVIDSSKLTISQEAELILNACNAKNKIFVITGPSGVGKTTIIEKILSSSPKLRRILTYTTRKPREEEANGKHYNFITKSEFEKKIGSREMFEYAEVYGNYYGSSKKDVQAMLDSGTSILLALDVQGAETVRKIFPESIIIFIIPPNMKELRKRIIKRGDNDEKDMEKRIKIAKEEMKKADNFDYKVENRDIKTTVRMIKDITG